MSEIMEMFTRAMMMGYTVDDLKKKYKEQVETIKKNFPKESADRILKDLTFQKYVENLVNKKQTPRNFKQ